MKCNSTRFLSPFLVLGIVNRETVRHDKLQVPLIKEADTQFTYTGFKQFFFRSRMSDVFLVISFKNA